MVESVSRSGSAGPGLCRVKGFQENKFLLGDWQEPRAPRGEMSSWKHLQRARRRGGRLPAPRVLVSSCPSPLLRFAAAVPAGGPDRERCPGPPHGRGRAGQAPPREGRAGRTGPGWERPAAAAGRYVGSGRGDPLPREGIGEPRQGGTRAGTGPGRSRDWGGLSSVPGMD